MPQIITLNATRYNGTILDRREETGPRGGVRQFWRRADKREGPDRILSLWYPTQTRAANS
jgi:hypothetical protein